MCLIKFALRYNLEAHNQFCGESLPLPASLHPAVAAERFGNCDIVMVGGNDAVNLLLYE